MVFKELEERIAPQLLVDWHEVGTAEVSRLSGFDGLVPSLNFRFKRALEDVVATFIDNDIFVFVNFDSPIVPSDGELAVDPELFGH